MRVAYNDYHDRAGLRGYVQCNKYTHTQTHTQQVSLIPPWEDQCEWHRMTRMTGPDCAVMCNLINTDTHTQQGGGNGDGDGVGGGNGNEVGGGGERRSARGNEDGSGGGAGREREREGGWRLLDEHRMGTVTGAGTKMGAVAEMGTGTMMEIGTGTRIGLGRMDEGRRRARNYTRVVDAMWKTRETWWKEEKA